MLNPMCLEFQGKKSVNSRCWLVFSLRTLFDAGAGAGVRGQGPGL
jgi:hypothetical protein